MVTKLPPTYIIPFADSTNNQLVPLSHFFEDRKEEVAATPFAASAKKQIALLRKGRGTGARVCS
jgi:hypothetical protein